MAVNVRGYFLYAKAAYPHLAATGSMVHISSDAGVLGEHGIGVYSVSKAAVVMLSNMLALDGGPDGVRSNCICPGDILPGMRHMSPPGEATARRIPRSGSFPRSDASARRRTWPARRSSSGAMRSFCTGSRCSSTAACGPAPDRIDGRSGL